MGLFDFLTSDIAIDLGTANTPVSYTHLDVYKRQIDDLLAYRWFMATASLLYRNYVLTEDFADWHARAAAGDWALVLQLAARGPIGYLPEVMGVYRKHRGGLSHVHAPTNEWFVQNRKEMFENVRKWMEERRLMS